MAIRLSAFCKSKSVGWLLMIEKMDALTERTNFVRINLGKQGNCNCNKRNKLEQNKYKKNKDIKIRNILFKKVPLIAITNPRPMSLLSFTVRFMLQFCYIDVT